MYRKEEKSGGGDGGQSNGAEGRESESWDEMVLQHERFDGRAQQADASEVSDWYRHGTSRRGETLRHSQRFIIIKRGSAAGVHWHSGCALARQQRARDYQKRETAVTARMRELFPLVGGVRSPTLLLLCLWLRGRGGGARRSRRSE